MNNYIKQISVLLILPALFIINGSAFASYCGDGVLNTDKDEACDDGNFDNRDGCSSYCEEEDMTPPTILSMSIAEGATGISNLTNKIIITFSEGMDESSINKRTIQLKQHATVLDTEYDISDNKESVTIIVNEDLYGEAEHAIVINNVKDLAGNILDNLVVRTFTTATAIDHTAPNIVVRPPGGSYIVTQSVNITPYVGKNTSSTDFEDEEATIYYTLDGSIPTINSDIYTKSFSINNDTILRYFGVDKSGNVSEITTHNYKFDCGEKLNAKDVTPYPSCNILECNYGFLLKNNVCVVNLNTDDSNIKYNAATAPMLGSNTPMIISTKPALYITPQHKGTIPRPIHFIDPISGITIKFERDTVIKNEDGSYFSGYIKPPDHLVSKNFPINFGFTFKSILNFEPESKKSLKFDPPYQITIPYTDRYRPKDKLYVFTYDPETEEYYKYPSDWVFDEKDLNQVTLMADSNNTFFIAQEGQNYNKIVFKDTADHWSRNYVESLYRKGIVRGRDKGIFAPDDILTRAEFTKVALSVVGEEVDPQEYVESAPFKDVALYAWYVPYVKRAKETGLINGYENGEFKPDQPINKAEAVTVLMRALEFDVHSAGIRGDNYSDILTSQWYFPFVNFAIQNKLIDGIRLPNGKIMTSSFGPSRNITRGEMAKLAIKAMELKETLDE